jgi:hypothetical protein
MRRGVMEQMVSLISLGDGSTLTLDFTTGVLDSRLTFTRASDATFINSQGFVQYAAVNYFSNTGWTSGTTPTGWNVTFGTGTTTWNADGTLTMTAGGSAVRPCINATSFSVAQGIPFTFGFRVTAVSGSPTIDQVISSTVAGETFSRNGATVSGSTVVQNGDIISCTFTPTTTSNAARMGPGVNVGVTNISITITQPQFNPGTTLQPYYANTSTIAARWDSARFDYDPDTRAPRGLLVEGSATNLATQSNGATSVWTIGGNRTPTNNTTDLVSPDNTNNATKLVCGTAGNYASFATLITGLTGGGTYTVSYWIRGPVGHTPRLYAVNGTVGDVTPTATTGTYNNTGWSRLTQTYTLPATTTQVYVYFMSLTIAVTGDTFYVYGFQLETGSGASSLIPTGASTATRNADNCELLDLSTMAFNASAGTIYTDVGTRLNTGSQRNYTFLPASGGNNQIFEGSGIALNVYSSGSFVAQIGTSTLAAQKIAAAYAVNDYAVSVAGGAVATDTSGALPTSLTKLTIGGSIINSAAYMNGCIRVFKYWPTRLPNATLQSLTT